MFRPDTVARHVTGKPYGATLHLLELYALLHTVKMEQTLNSSMYRFACARICSVCDLFSEVVSKTVYSIERYSD